MVSEIRWTISSVVDKTLTVGRPIITHRQAGERSSTLFFQNFRFFMKPVHGNHDSCILIRKTVKLMGERYDGERQRMLFSFFTLSTSAHCRPRGECVFSCFRNGLLMRCYLTSDDLTSWLDVIALLAPCFVIVLPRGVFSCRWRCSAMLLLSKSGHRRHVRRSRGMRPLLWLSVSFVDIHVLDGLSGPCFRCLFEATALLPHPLKGSIIVLTL